MYNAGTQLVILEVPDETYRLLGKSHNASVHDLAAGNCRLCNPIEPAADNCRTALQHLVG